MCGVCGVIRPAGTGAGDLEVVAALNRDQRHRGPDQTVAQLRKRIPNRYPYRGAGTPTSFADFFIYEPAA
jgi:hypothetical protein